MRLRVLTLPVLALASATALTTTRPLVPRVPQQAQITSACTEGVTPKVTPAVIAMARADNIQWRSVSPGATSWTITPKDPKNWLFEATSITGDPESPATSTQPLPSAVEGYHYGYSVRITCSDSTSQVIDPDIVVGGSE